MEKVKSAEGAGDAKVEADVIKGSPLREALSSALYMWPHDQGQKPTLDQLIEGLDSVVREAGGKDAAAEVMADFVRHGLVKYAENETYMPLPEFFELVESTSGSISDVLS